MSCDIHTHTPASKSYTNFICIHLFYQFVLQTVLGMGMGMHVTAKAAPRRADDAASPHTENPQD